MFEVGEVVEITSGEALAKCVVLGHDSKRHLILGAMTSPFESLRSTRVRLTANDFIYPNILGTFWEHQVTAVHAARTNLEPELLNLVRDWAFVSKRDRARFLKAFPERLLIGNLDADRSLPFYGQSDAFLIAATEVVKSLELGVQALSLPELDQSTERVVSTSEMQKFAFILAVANSLNYLKAGLEHSQDAIQTKSRLLLRQAVSAKTSLGLTHNHSAEDRIEAFFKLFKISTLLVESSPTSSFAEHLNIFRARFPNFVILEGA